MEGHCAYHRRASGALGEARRGRRMACGWWQTTSPSPRRQRAPPGRLRASATMPGRSLRVTYHILQPHPPPSPSDASHGLPLMRQCLRVAEQSSVDYAAHQEKRNTHRWRCCCKKRARIASERPQRRGSCPRAPHQPSWRAPGLTHRCRQTPLSISSTTCRIRERRVPDRRRHAPSQAARGTTPRSARRAPPAARSERQ